MGVLEHIYKRSLPLKILLVTFSAAILLTFLEVGIYTLYEVSRNQQKMVTMGDGIARNFESALTRDPGLLLDPAKIKQHLNGILSYQQVGQVTLRLKNGLQWNVVSDVTQFASSDYDEKRLPVFLGRDDQKKLVGELLLRTDGLATKQNIFGSFFILLPLSLVKMFFLLWVLSWVVKHKVVRRLKAITRSLAKIQPDRVNTERTIRLDEGQEPLGYDEIQELVEVLDQLIQGVAAHNAQEKALQEKQNKVLEAEQARSVAASRLASLGEMAAGIAHEVNNPLAIIQLSLKTISSRLKELGVQDPIVQELCSQGDATLVRIGKINKSLLKFSRDGERDSPEVVGLYDWIEEILVFYRSKAQKAGVDIHLRFNIDKDTKIMTRPVPVSQVLINILNNALDELKKLHDSKKEVGITVCYKNQNLQIRVTNSGPKIPEDIADKIFEPFYTSKPIGQGTGLGLSISKGIMAQEDGDIYVDLNEDDTTFVIAFSKLNSSLEVA